MLDPVLTFAMQRPTDFEAIQIMLASPERIREWSHGEVTKPETINYRSFKPERDGLFCERIFGPTKDWECYCGKYKRIRYRGVICDRCGVEVIQSKVRRERLAHIELAVPVAHIWYVKSVPSRIGHLLDLTVRDLERVIYYESYALIDPGDTGLEPNTLLTEHEVAELEDEGKKFVADMGAGAVCQLLRAVDVEQVSIELRTQARVETSVQRKQEALKRLKVVEAFRQSGNRPDWMIMDVVPVIPPDLRPLVPLEGGRFATSDLNDLYRRVINRNNRLKKLVDIRAPDVILRNEKRMLQEAVDALFDNGRRTRAVRGDSDRALKSLSDLLKGKQGRFRQNLLGKRVDYSGRSVIVVGPELRLHQCGLPKAMALELFKPFVIKKLEDRGFVQTVKSAKKLVERERPEVWDILEEVIRDHVVLLNRPPTLHRLGIQAFEPALVEGKAIRIHPLVCAAFNADFDGDAMAVHVPLSFEAQVEAKVLMLSANNILSPASGKPVVVDKPQEIVLGCYWLTKADHADKSGAKRRFANPEEALLAYEHKRVGLKAPVGVRTNGQVVETTVGRLLFNQILPPEMPFVNEVIDHDKMREIVTTMHRNLGNVPTVQFLDNLKDLGFKHATLSGCSVGLDAVIVPPNKTEIIDRAHAEVHKVLEQYERGLITDGERYNKVIDIWEHATTEVTEAMREQLREDQGGFNPVHAMQDSGARGSVEQIRQLAGMRGLMHKPKRKITGGVGEIIEMPILSSLKEGLSVLEYFISTHGARKGLADTALKTADAGYLTRRLVDVAQDVIVDIFDCGTVRSLEVGALKEGEEIVEPLRDRILGRVTLEDVYDPVTDELIIEAGSEIDEEISESIEKAGIETVRIRSVLTCEAPRGVCTLCYGRNLGTGKLVNIGEAVGVVAAQSIGEPGTQLTLRTFHIGGTASRITQQSRIQATRPGVVRLFEDEVPVEWVVQPDGRRIVTSRRGAIRVEDEHGRALSRFEVPYAAVLQVDDGQEVEADDVLYEWDLWNHTILTEYAGIIRFRDIIEGVTMREELDETTGLRQRVIVEQRNRALSPLMEVLDDQGAVRRYLIPVGAYLLVNDGQELALGDTLAKVPREAAKTRDITGGLPRVVELFEARKPKDPAVVTEIDGIVKLGGIVRGSREISVVGDDGDERKYLIPYGKHLRVHDGDHVASGERLCEGSVNPHDILGILGVYKVQEYLVNEIQEVYRLQGVQINDKHIEVIARQMLEKVRIVDPGDTGFLEGEQVDRRRFAQENERTLSAGGLPATSEPILLGISRASLTTESFISAASFQETTRVLTEAAVSGKIDRLNGLKENVIIGHLIPAGTGSLHYRQVSAIESEVPEEERAVEMTPEKLAITPEVEERLEAYGISL